jgi:hypothetical protein
MAREAEHQPGQAPVGVVSGSSQNSKALFGEVIVESKGGIELMLSHGGETDAINQAEAAAVGGENGRHAGMMQLFIYPDNAQEGRDIFMKGADLPHTQAILHQSGRFQQYITGTKKGCLLFCKLAPNALRPRMIAFISV